MKKLTIQEIQVGLFFLWIILLLPWLLLAPISAMAFDAGPSIGAYFFTLPILTYPIPVILAAIFRRKHPRIAFLPLVNLIVLGFDILLWKPKLTDYQLAFHR